MSRRRPWRWPDRKDLGPLVFSVILLGMIALLLVLPPVRSRRSEDLPRIGTFAGEPEVRVLIQSLRPGSRLRLGQTPLHVVGPKGRHLVPAGGGGRLEYLGGRRARLAGLTIEMPSRLVPGDGAPGIVVAGRTYPGAVDLTVEGRRLEVICNVPLEDYVAGVIMAEMGPAFPDEALRAQAIAARSYAVERMLRRQSATYDLRSDQRAQVFKGLPAQKKRARRIVESTLGEVLAHDERVLPAYFASTCGGRTRAAGEAFGGETLQPLGGVTCGYCDDAPLHTWTAKTTRQAFARALGLSPRGLRVVALEHRDSGRLAHARIRAGGRTQKIGVGKIKRAMGPRARSTWIEDLIVDGDRVVARGRGFGHGVGLCQYGARGLAEAGFDAERIVSLYYPDASLARLYELHDN